MNIQSLKISIIQEVLNLENEAFIKDLENYLKQKKNEMAENNLTPMSMKQFESEIKQSLNDIKNGRVVEVSELKKAIKEWN